MTPLEHKVRSRLKDAHRTLTYQMADCQRLAQHYDPKYRKVYDHLDEALMSLAHAMQLIDT